MSRLPLGMREAFIAITFDDRAHDLVEQEADADRRHQAHDDCLQLVHLSSPLLASARPARSGASAVRAVRRVIAAGEGPGQNLLAALAAHAQPDPCRIRSYPTLTP